MFARSLSPTMVFEQVIEDHAVARREDTLEVHEKEIAAERVFFFEEFAEDDYVVGDNTGALRCRNRLEEPDIKDR